MSEFEEISNLDNKLKLGFLINTTFTIFEFIIGILSGSLALISDSGHNLTDSLSIIISLFANKISRRLANPEHSYGYGRATILAALFNTFILVDLALYIFYEAYNRILSPHPVTGTTIILVSIIGIFANGAIAWILSKEKKDLNIRSVFANIFSDVIALTATLIAGILLYITKQPIIDSLIAIMIGLMLLYAALKVTRDAIHILLEGIPERIDIKKVKELIEKTHKVKGVDDMHIWAISSHYAALSCHIVIEDCDVEESTRIIKEIKDKLKQEFHIEHATIETELTECPPDK